LEPTQKEKKHSTVSEKQEHFSQQTERREQEK
jgi:hypothetical protein